MATKIALAMGGIFLLMLIMAGVGAKHNDDKSATMALIVADIESGKTISGQLTRFIHQAIVNGWREWHKPLI